MPKSQPAPFASSAESGDPLLEFSTHVAAYTVAIETAEPAAAAQSLAKLRTLAAEIAAPRMRWTVGIYETFDATMAARLDDAERLAAENLELGLQIGEMLEAGLLDEVRGLVDRGFGAWLTSAQAIGYAELSRHLAGELSLEDAIAATVKRTKALARRQMAFLRRDPRIRWFAASENGAADVVDDIAEHLDG